MYRLILLLLFVPISVLAVDTPRVQTPQSIRQAVEKFLQQQAVQMKGDIEVSVAPIDPRLRLASCDDGQMESFWPKGGRRMGNVSVGLRCHGPVSWSIYVRGRLLVYETVAVAARPLSRGERLSAADIDLQRQDVSRLSGGYQNSVDDVVGMEVRRSVRAGMVLNRSVVRPPILVNRGERVSITAANGTVHVSMEGKALASGARGELIEVVNLSSRNKLEAEVIAPGVVRVRM
jgi:flagellar basal body P-ring formation protein FlgA